MVDGVASDDDSTYGVRGGRINLVVAPAVDIRRGDHIPAHNGCVGLNV